ncbi:MAG: hypothetical protein WC455_28520 [Dehalococcoidia bacterium]|jgi:hypothetical protein
MSERTTWTTEDEIQFIDSLPTKRVSLGKYAWVLRHNGLRKRKNWCDADRKEVFKHLKERMG